MSILKRRKRRKESSYNKQCCLVTPIQKGFPITDFAVTDDNKHLITGNAVGCISAYNVPRPEHLETKEEEDQETYHCFRLQKGSDAAVRHLWIQKDTETREKRVYALIGFDKLYIWNMDNIFKPNSDGIKPRMQKEEIKHNFYKYTHTDKYAVRKGAHIGLFASTCNRMYMIDCSSAERGFSKQKQSTMTQQLGKKTRVVSFDGKTFCLVDSAPGLRLHFMDLATFRIWDESLDLSRKYSGFQLVGTKLAYCFNNTVVEVRDLRDSQQVIWRCKGHKGYILAMHFDGELVITMGMDRKIKLWRNGEIFKKIKNVPGVFNPGYLYKVWYGGSAVYYTADNGVFVAYFN
jgi:hypothetical protein